jgi:hypothetical protein
LGEEIQNTCRNNNNLMLRSATLLACHFSILEEIWLEVVTANIWLVIFGTVLNLHPQINFR